MAADVYLRRGNVPIALAIGAVLAALVVGCSSGSLHKDWATLLNTAQKADAAKKAELKSQPKFEIGGQTLGEGHEVSLTPQQLTSRLQELLTAQRPGWAAHWVERHPDAALELLRSDFAAEQDAALIFVARVHDRQCTLRESLQSWTSLLAAAKQQPAPFTKYSDARKEFKAVLQDGNADKALKLDLNKLAGQTGSPLLKIDALQLTATAYLLGDRPAQAVDAFSRAVELADHVSAYQETYLLLLLSDAQRRAGNAQLASDTWRQAIMLAGRQLGSSHPALDPVLWERLSYLRPVELAWPGEVVQELAQQFPLFGLDAEESAELPSQPSRADAVIWNAIGRWYLDRNHAQAALVSFKRAEAAVEAPLAQQWLRICEARALVFLDQIGPATAILMPIAADSDSPMARPAMGLLGSLRLKSGQLPQGLGLLQKSIEKDETAAWPDRTQSLADLGLAYLMMGDEAAGLRRLHEAQHQFEIEGEQDSLVLALENEAAYLSGSKRKKEAEQIKRRVQQLEQVDNS